jgi:hypothetical protein
VLAPLRPTSGDTIGGRFGGLTLRCAGDYDVSRVDWIGKRTQVKRVYYWIEPEPDRLGQMVSVFGPAPAVVGAAMLLDVGPGDEISDDTLRRRERDGAALLVALAAALLVIAAASRVGPLAAGVAGLLGAGSFAGAATFGQGLWQASVSLPFLMGALATLAWRPRRPLLAYLTPGLLLVSVLIRPTIAPLSVGLGIGWAIQTRDRKVWLGAAVVALVMAAPWLWWNTAHLGTPFPVGQWHSNKRMTGHVFDVSPGHIGYAVGGLLLSPGRGLLWYAPIALLGAATAIRSRDLLERTVALCVVAQICFIGLFFKWYGGYAFGPRLVAETVWLGAWLVIVRPGQRRVLRAIAIAVTLLVGQLGLWQFRSEQWEDARMPDIDENALWDFVDSPISAMFVGENGLPGIDAAPVDGYRCERNGAVTSIGSHDRGPPPDDKHPHETERYPGSRAGRTDPP